MRPERESERDRLAEFEAWQTAVAVCGVGLYLVHIAALGGGAWVVRNWVDDYPQCVWAPGAYLLGAGVTVVALPFVASLIARMMNAAGIGIDTGALLAWLFLTVLEVMGALTLFKWAPKSCADRALWSVAFALWTTDALIWLFLCFAPLLLRRRRTGYKFFGVDTTYQSVPLVV